LALATYRAAVERWPGGAITCRVRSPIAAKREFVSRELTADWTPHMLRSPEVLIEADVVEAEAELRALQCHALAVIDPEAGN
jgi:hypothetical protein